MKLIKKFLTIVILLILMPINISAGIICSDGWESSCTISGPGCCSHHGGVGSKVNYNNTSYYEDETFFDKLENGDYVGIVIIIILILTPIIIGIYISRNKSVSLNSELKLSENKKENSKQNNKEDRNKDTDDDYYLKILIGILILMAIFIISICLESSTNNDATNQDILEQETTDNNLNDQNTNETSNSQYNTEDSKINSTEVETNTRNDNNYSENKNSQEKKAYCLIETYKLDTEDNICYEEYNAYKKDGTCPEGFKSFYNDKFELKCKKETWTYDVMIYSNPHCASYQEAILEEKVCVEPKRIVNKGIDDCKNSGLYWSNTKNACYNSYANLIYDKSCPEGWELTNSNVCYKYEELEPTYTYYCFNNDKLDENRKICRRIMKVMYKDE